MLVTAISAATLSPSVPGVERTPTVPKTAPVSLPHELVLIIERRFAKVEADLTTRELVFTRKFAEGGVHGIIEYPDTNSHMRQSGLWFYRDPVRKPLPRGLCMVAIRKDDDLSLAIIYPMEDDIIVKGVD
jgi:hypothetical protein